MNVDYVWVFFIPGAAGNFLSRCLNLLDDAYCFGKKDHALPVTLEEKASLFNYDDVSQLGFNDRNWKQFESNLRHYRDIVDIDNIPANSLAIWFSHPNIDMLNQGIVGKDDREFIVYIDPGEYQEWALMNALYKNSFIDVRWLVDALKIEAMPGVIKFPVRSLLGTEQQFITAFKELASSIGRSVSSESENAIKTLWNSWRKTVLNPADIPAFKRLIGLKL